MHTSTKHKKLSNNATASTTGIVYQLWVAVRECYKMYASGQKILIETQGDITSDAEKQIEVKHRTDPLTDNHPCFWNTIKNWMQEDFDPTHYKALILLTTQRFGNQAAIATWNDASCTQRKEILQKIFQNNQEETQAQPSKVFETQQYVLDTTRQDKLDQVIERVFIEAESDKLPELYERIKGEYLKHILESKREDFLNALFGYIAQPRDTKSWEIEYDDFCKKEQELSSIYCHGTKTFPRVTVSISEEITNLAKERLFAKKISDIQYNEVLNEAIEHYHIAIKTVNEEFRNYSVLQSSVNQYTDELIARFKTRYRYESRNCNDVIKDSKNLYDKVTVETPQTLSGFDATPLAFRNGLIHAEMDDKDKQLKWKLEPDE